jgi:poly-gamma-glutamate system protein
MTARLDPRSRAFAVTALWSVAVFLAVDFARTLPRDPLRETKLRAARIMAEGTSVLRAERLRRGLAIDETADPNRTGLIGRDYTDLTTTLGGLPAKRTSTDPAFAAVVVAMLDAAGVNAGDTIAASFSGSFPALNLAVLAAAKALNLHVVIISSVGASSWGANEPGWTWPDMERALREHGVVSRGTSAVALGGIVDEGGGLDGTGLEFGREALRRSNLPVLDEGGRATLAADVARRLEFFDRGTSGRPAAFVNVGGNLTSLGATAEEAVFPAGLSRSRPRASTDPRRGVLTRMAERGVPVIHLLGIRQLAARYGLPFDPRPLLPAADAAVLRPTRHSRAFAAGGLALIGAALFWTHRRIRSARTAAPLHNAL